MGRVLSCAIGALVLTFLLVAVASAAESSLPLRGPSACEVLATNMGYTAQWLEKQKDEKAAVDEAIAYHNKRIEDCFTTPGTCIFTNQAKAKLMIEGLVQFVGKLVFERKMPADAVASAIYQQCVRVYHPNDKEM